MVQRAPERTAFDLPAGDRPADSAPSAPATPPVPVERRLCMGNEAIGLAAIAAGVNVACGYPGTPSTEIVETMKPAQIMRSAVWPAAIVSGLELNTFISGPANTRHSTVPPAMMVPVMARVRL